MNIRITRVDIWAAEIDDMPGGLARTLRSVADYGFDLDYVIARRQPDKPGKGIVLVSPSSGKQQLDVASDAGLRRTTATATLKIEGPSGPGVGSKITKTIAETGVSINGLSAAVIGHRFVCYAAFDNEQDLEKAEAALKTLATPHHWRFWERHPEPKAA